MSGILASTFFAAVAPWVPTNLSTLVGWYDANNSSSITNVSGKASQWNDLSSNANNVVQATAGSRPTIAAGINSLGTLQYASGNFLALLGLTGFPNNTTGIGFAVAARFTSFSASTSLWDVSDNTSTNRTALVPSGSSTTLQARAGGSTNAASITFSDTTGAHVFSGHCKTNARAIAIDGGTAATNTSSNTALNSTNLRIGLLFQGVNPFIGQYGELVFFSGTSTTDQQLLEGYLAWKWGLQANLPNGHPYKNAPP